MSLNIGRLALGRGRIVVSQSTTRQAIQSWQHQFATASSHGYNSSPNPLLTNPLLRTYATATATATSTKPRTRRATGTKSATKAKKPAAKPKKKTVAKKPAKKKPAKKPELTEEQRAAAKAKADEKKAKLKLKELNEAALLDAPKPLPSTARYVYTAEHLKGRPTSSLLFKEVFAGFASLNTADREHYNHVANENKRANEAVYKQWVDGHTPEQIARANTARTVLRRSKGKSKNFRRLEPIRDERLPKRPAIKRALFIRDRFRSGDMQGIAPQDAMRQLNKEFKSLSASELKTYEDMEEAERSRYEKEYKSAFGTDAPASK